jgi:hypothetical protein
MAIGVGFGALGSLAPFPGVARRRDSSRALGPLTEHRVALWLVVALAVGLARITRADGA